MIQKNKYHPDLRMAAIRRASTVLRSQKPVMVKRKQTHLELLSRALSQGKRDVRPPGAGPSPRGGGGGGAGGGGGGGGGGGRREKGRDKEEEKTGAEGPFRLPHPLEVQSSG